MKHEDGKSDEMQTAKGFRRSLEVTGQSAEMSGSGKTPFDDPASGQEDKAFLGFGQLDHNQINASFFGLLLRNWTGIALIYKSDFHRIVRYFLHGLCQFPDLGTLLFIGWCDVSCQP